MLIGSNYATTVSWASVGVPPPRNAPGPRPPRRQGDLDPALGVIGVRADAQESSPGSQEHGAARALAKCESVKVELTRPSSAGSRDLRAIEITERPGSPNWIAGAPFTDPDRVTRFQEKVAQLRNSDPEVDWNDVTESAGNSRRIARWLSEVEALIFIE